MDEQGNPILRESDEEYEGFISVSRSSSSRKCPSCQTETIRMLWLGDPDHVTAGKIWGKWYLWCDRCLKGIRCPLGSYAVPDGEPYIRWGDDVALRRALPSELQLLVPKPKANLKQEELQKLFDKTRGIQVDEPDSSDQS